MKLLTESDLGSVPSEQLIQELLGRYHSAILCWSIERQPGIWLRHYDFLGCSSSCIGLMEYAKRDLVQPSGIDLEDLGIEE